MIKPIPNYSHYFADELGNIYSEKINGTKLKFRTVPQKMKLRTNKLGYKTVGLYVDNKHHIKTVHRLIAITFIPNPSNKNFVLHKTPNPSNNAVTNLYWGDHRDNQNDVIKDKSRSGERNPNAKFTVKQVHEIRNLFKSGISAVQLAKRYNVNKGTIYKIISNYLWKT